MLIAICVGILLVLMVCYKINSKQNKLMATFANAQEAIDALTAEVAKNTTVEKSALALIQGFSKQLADAVAAAQAAGATPAQLQSLSDLRDTLSNSDTELSDAVAANTAPPTS